MLTQGETDNTIVTVGCRLFHDYSVFVERLLAVAGGAHEMNEGLPAQVIVCPRR